MVVWVRLGDLFLSQNPRETCLSHFPGWIFKLYIYHLLGWSNFIFLHNFQWIIFPNHSCLVLYSFCTNLLHSLIWLIVSSQSTQNLHLLSYCILSIFALTLFLLMTLICGILLLLLSLYFYFLICFNFFYSAAAFMKVKSEPFVDSCHGQLTLATLKQVDFDTGEKTFMTNFYDHSSSSIDSLCSSPCSGKESNAQRLRHSDLSQERLVSCSENRWDSKVFILTYFSQIVQFCYFFKVFFDQMKIKLLS